MKVVVNGISRIEKELEKAYQQELDSVAAEIAAKKRELQKESKLRTEARVADIRRSAERKAALEKQRRVARARAELESELLAMKERQLAELQSLFEQSLGKLGKAEKERFVNAALQDALKQMDEPVDVVEVPEGISPQTNLNVSDSLDRLGVVVRAKSGAVVRKMAEIDRQQLAKLLVKEGVWKD